MISQRPQAFTKGEERWRDKRQRCVERRSVSSSEVLRLEEKEEEEEEKGRYSTGGWGRSDCGAGGRGFYASPGVRWVGGRAARGDAEGWTDTPAERGREKEREESGAA